MRRTAEKNVNVITGAGAVAEVYMWVSVPESKPLLALAMRASTTSIEEIRL
jgi:hypothetical protein